MKLKGSQARTDNGSDSTVLLNADSGEIKVLTHAQKSWMSVNLDMMKGIMAMAGKMSNGKEPAKMQATGQKEKVGDWDAEIYTWDGPLGTGKFWISKDFPKYTEIMAVQAKMTKAMGNPMAGLGPDPEQMPGMVVKSEVKVLGQPVTTELVSAKEEEVDASIFAVPTDYKEMKLPFAIPGAGGAGVPAPTK